MPTIYTLKMDSRYPYALVLQDGFKRPDKYEGYSSTRELHEHMQNQFGSGVQRLSGTAFQAELEKRLIHTPEVTALLKTNGELLGLDLTKHFVYGSFNRPMNSMWARIDQAVYIQCNKALTGHHTYVAVPELLDKETVARYELEFVSRAIPSEQPSECDLLTLRGIPIEVDDGGQS